MLPNSAIYEAVFEKYPSWDECVRAAFFQTHARKLNMARRHLNQEQRAALWVDMRKDGMSYRQIAETDKTASKDTIKRAVENSGVSFDTPAVTGKDGKQYPAKQASRKPAPELPSIPQRPISINVAKPEQISRETKKAQEVIETGHVVHCTTSTGKDGKERPRQIAEETKIPKSTVHRIISTVSFDTVEPPTVITGKDGKKRQATQPERKAPQPNGSMTTSNGWVYRYNKLSTKRISLFPK